MLVGFQFNPVDNVSITPNVEIVKYQADPVNGGDKNDFTPRISFCWEF